MKRVFALLVLVIFVQLVSGARAEQLPVQSMLPRDLREADVVSNIPQTGASFRPLEQETNIDILVKTTAPYVFWPDNDPNTSFPLERGYTANCVFSKFVADPRANAIDYSPLMSDPMVRTKDPAKLSSCPTVYTKYANGRVVAGTQYVNERIVRLGTIVAFLKDYPIGTERHAVFVWVWQAAIVDL